MFSQWFLVHDIYGADTIIYNQGDKNEKVF